MSQAASVIDYAMQIARAGTSAALAICLGTSPTDAARNGFYGDTTGGAEKVAMVVGGQTGPVYTRSGTDVNAAFSGAVSVTKQITSTLATGTAPLVVASTTVVANLNVSALLGSTWASPAAIGTGTPAAGTFTALTNSALTSGRIPVASTGGLLADFAGFTFSSGLLANNRNATALPTAITGTVLALAQADDTATGVMLDAYGTGNAFVAGRRAKTSAAGKTAVTTDDILLSLSGYGYGATAYSASNMAVISLRAAEPWSDAAQGTYIRFSTTALGGTTTASRFQITGASASFTAGTPLTVADTTVSSSTGTGAFIVGGGGGFAGKIYCVGINVGAASTLNGAVTITGTSGPLSLTQGAAASGLPHMIQAIPGAHTGLTSGTECSDYNFDMARTVTWATSTPATQRGMLITAPTYACDTAAQTITTAATVAISAAPSGSANVTITNPYALWVQAGNVLFAGRLSVTDGSTSALSVAGRVTSNLGLFVTTGSGTASALTLAQTGISSWSISNVATTGVLAIGTAATFQTAAASAAAPGFTTAETSTITGGVTDGYTSGYRLSPTYSAATALTVTRHNYLDINNPVLAGVGPAALTDACLFRTNAAIGTHKMIDAATTKTTPGAVDFWIKVNSNGTVGYVAGYFSKTA